MAVSLANTRSFDYTLIPNDKYNGHWATPYLYVAEMQEIIEPGEINNIPGYANIDDPITRMEVIRILSRIQINMKSVPKKESMMVNYLDVDPNDYSQEDRSYILHAANYNLIDGMVPVDDSPLYLRPTDPITRAEAVRAILRVY
jgi:hypothetical protein